MSTKRTIEILQNLHKTVPEVKYAPTIYPGSINSADLPLLITLPKSGFSSPITSKAELNSTVRTYQVKCFYEPVSQNLYGASLNNIIDLIDIMNQLYWSNRYLDDGYVEIVSWTDSGLISGDFGFNTSAPIIWAGHFYRGFAFDLNVMELKQ